MALELPAKAIALDDGVLDLGDHPRARGRAREQNGSAKLIVAFASGTSSIASYRSCHATAVRAAFVNGYAIWRT